MHNHKTILQILVLDGEAATVVPVGQDYLLPALMRLQQLCGENRETSVKTLRMELVPPGYTPFPFR